MRARYYDQNLGRFISEDPLGFAGGDVNLYLYGHNNPLRFIDPLGLCSITLGEKIGAQVRGQVAYSGLYDMPGIAKEAVQVLVAAGVGVATYTAYPAIISTIIMHPEKATKVTEFISGISPGSAPKTPRDLMASTTGAFLGIK